MDKIINDLIIRLHSEADEKIKISGERYFKEPVILRGIRNATVMGIGREHYRLLEKKEKNYVFQLCTQLWGTGYIEDTFIACQWSYNVHKQYIPDDISVFYQWVSVYVNNWASCDTLCNHSVGTLIMKFPALINNLKEWTASENRWVKRAAAVSLIIPARKGLFHKEIFEIADSLLYDKDDMVQKGYGWMLKSASQSNQDSVFDFVMARKKDMPRTSLRYAIEKMPQELKALAMAK